jgi:hypothetical protein
MRIADDVEAYRRREERTWAASQGQSTTPLTNSWRWSEHVSGKMANALGHALPGESQEELDRIAAEDQRLAQKGIVKLKTGESVYYKHIDELTREDRKVRIATEREEVAWLKKRLGLPRD